MTAAQMGAAVVLAVALTFVFVAMWLKIRKSK